MKKTYIQPACITLGLGTTVSILAGSPQKVNPGSGPEGEIKKDPSGTGWAGAKGDHFNVWETDEDEE